MSLNMIDEAPAKDEESADRLLKAAEAVRASGVLGRSRQLRVLFDYLVDRSAQDRPPKESEIAHEVFGKSGGFETGQDAVVRVNVHRLRSKLEEYAASVPGQERLALPKGGYRVVLLGPPAKDTAPAATPPPRRWMLWAVAAAVLALGVGGTAAWLERRTQPATATALQKPVWRAFAASPNPLLLVVGDYYIFGETEDGMQIDRLVREFPINSAADLEQYLAEHPDKADRYRDMGLSYLPTSSAAAVSRIALLFAGTKPVQVIMASELTPQLLKTHDIIYLGYLSGLGPLRDPVFATSRFSVGDSYDEIVDGAGRQRYTSQGGFGPAQQGVYRDYSYVTAFMGPAGNHVFIIAGLRDIGLSAAAEQMTDPVALATLTKFGAGDTGFEALYEVHGQGEVNYQTRLITGSRRARQAWTTPDPPAPAPGPGAR